MLRPFLLVGVGGSGGKTLRIVREDLLRRLRQTGGWETDDLPAAWQFIHIDVPTHADGDDADLPDQLPERQYKGMVATGVDYAAIDTAILQKGGRTFADAVATWRPDPNTVNVSPAKGAGQYRTLGRIITTSGLSRILDAVQRARSAMTGTGVVDEMQTATRLLGGKPKNSVGSPTVIVVSSIAGGTGAGAVIDVCDVIRSLPDKWASDSVGFLYAPDVFDYLPDEARRGVRANALGSLAEILNGYWNSEGPSEATSDLFDAYGVNLNSGARRSGPRYPFLVGAKNEHVTYKTQNDIYRAMGRSIASWVASEKLQDSFAAYLEAQWSATNNSVIDNLRLHDQGTETPFCAIGSARVGLGRDRFIDYASQHLAKGVITRIIEEHEVHRGRSDDRTSKQIIRDQADLVFQGFLERSHVNERSPEKNDIVDALRPGDQKDRGHAFVQKVKLTVQKHLAVRKKGARPDEVTTWLTGAVQDGEREFLAGLRGAMYSQGQQWCADIQDHLQSMVAAQVGLNGAPVAEAVLDKLENELRFVEDQLKGEAFTYQEWSRQKAALVSQAFSENNRATITSTSDPLLDKTIKDAVTSVVFTHEAELHELVAKLIPDLIKGVVLPLKDAVKNAHQSLVVERAKTNSAIALWPESDVVPVRLLPAPNEFLLEEPSAYPKILTDLVERTINPGDGDSALREAELQVLLGTDELQSDVQKLVGRTRRWVPKDHNLQADFGAVPQRALFELAAKPEQVLGRAEEWLRKEGTAVGRYMSQGLRDYLSPDVVSPAEHDSRLNQFRGKLISALNASAPLVKVNPAVLVNVHGVDRVAYTSHFGEIPLPANTPGRDAVRSVLESRDEWREEVNKAFTDGNGGFIDVFTHLNAAYEPVVFDSLMKPIASDWGQKSTTADRRAEFWRWRRARPLTEFIPVSTSILKLMVKGWFVAARLDHLDLDEGAIWVPDTNTAAGFMAAFPEIMLRQEAVKSSEGVAVALESMMLALIEVNIKEQIKPFAAYERLRQLGEETSSGFGARPINPELEAFIIDGTNTRPGLPAPAGTPAARQAKLLDEVVTLLDRYRQHFAHIAKTHKVPLDVPPTWDLRKLIDASLTELMHTVQSIEPERGGGGWA